jgi:hypothetical protein
MSRFLANNLFLFQQFVAAGDFLVYKCPTWAWYVRDAAVGVIFPASTLAD